MKPMTKQEQEAIAALKALAKKWPKTLWLFVAGEHLHVLRTHEGERAMKPSGSVDDTFTVAEVALPVDGGDW